MPADCKNKTATLCCTDSCQVEYLNAFSKLAIRLWSFSDVSLLFMPAIMQLDDKDIIRGRVGWHSWLLDAFVAKLCSGRLPWCLLRQKSRTMRCQVTQWEKEKPLNSGFYVKCGAMCKFQEFGPSTRSIFTFAVPALVMPKRLAAP